VTRGVDEVETSVVNGVEVTADGVEVIADGVGGTMFMDDEECCWRC
jgi:hypothetical protein